MRGFDEDGEVVRGRGVLEGGGVVEGECVAMVMGRVRSGEGQKGS